MLFNFLLFNFQSCKEKGIKFTIDAEQTYIQAALAYFVLVLQQKYNTEIPLVYNTYQCYRKVSLKCCLFNVRDRHLSLLLNVPFSLHLAVFR